MRRLVIDRFEGKYVICEDSDQRHFAIDIHELPEGIKEGDVIDISMDGEISFNAEETQNRKKRIQGKQGRAFK